MEKSRLCFEQLALFDFESQDFSDVIKWCKTMSLLDKLFDVSLGKFNLAFFNFSGATKITSSNSIVMLLAIRSFV